MKLSDTRYYAGLGLALIFLGLVAIAEWVVGVYRWYSTFRGNEFTMDIFGVEISKFLALSVYMLLILTGFLVLRLYYVEKRNVFMLSSISTIVYGVVLLIVTFLETIFPSVSENISFVLIHVVSPYARLVIWIMIGTCLYIIGDTFLDNKNIRIASLLMVFILFYPFGLILAGKELMETSIEMK